MTKLGSTVTFRPHAEHPRLVGFPELAAIVGRVNDDGTLDLMVFVPNAEPVWMDSVPEGDSAFTFAPMDRDSAAETALMTANDAKHLAEQAHNAATNASILAESSHQLASQALTGTAPPTAPPAAIPTGPKADAPPADAGPGAPPASTATATPPAA